MGDELARLRTTRSQVQAVDDVIESPFQKLHERAARLSRYARRLAEIVFELRFMDAVIAAHLLLFTQLAPVFRRLLPSRLPLRLLSRRGSASFDRALFRQAAIALKEEFDFFTGFARCGFAAAEAADWSRISRHFKRRSAV